MILELKQSCAICFVIDSKATVLPVKQFDSVMGAIEKNVDNTMRRIEIITAYQLWQTKNTLIYVHGSYNKPEKHLFR